jgi:hypothetical protein
MAFVKANYNENTGGRIWSIKAGDRGETGHNLYRVLPPYGKQAASQKYIVYGAQHFGYSGIDPFEPNGDPKARPFKCVKEEDYKTKMVTVECAECTNRDAYLAKKAKLEAELKVQGATDEQIRADKGIEQLNSWLRQHNIDSKHYIAVMNEKREFGVLKVPTKAKKKLVQLIKDLNTKEKLDATDVDQGVWFDFQRTGEGFTNTVYDVELVYGDQVLPDGRRVKVLNTVPLSVEEQNQAIKVLPELQDIIPVISAEQIQQLVNSNGEPEVVDAIMNAGQKKGTAERLSRPAQEGVSRPTFIPPPVRAEAPAPVAVQAPAPAPAAETQEQREFREFQEFKASQRAKAVTAAPVATAAASAPAPQAAAVTQPVGFRPPAETGPMNADSFAAAWGFTAGSPAGATK